VAVHRLAGETTAIRSALPCAHMTGTPERENRNKPFEKGGRFYYVQVSHSTRPCLVPRVVSSMRGDLNKKGKESIVFIVTIDSDICSGCGECTRSCPAQILALVENKATVVGEDCLGCQACVGLCQSKAITVDEY